MNRTIYDVGISTRKEMYCNRQTLSDATMRKVLSILSMYGVPVQEITSIEINRVNTKKGETA